MNFARVLVFMLFATAGGLEAAAGAPDPAQLKLGSSNALVFDPSTGRELYRKGADEITPIASTRSGWSSAHCSAWKPP